MANGRKDFFGLPVSVGTLCDPSEKMTRESDADSADINKILKRAGVTDPRQLAVAPGVFLDVSELGDYRVLADRLVAVNEYFDGLPAGVRAEFRNDSLVFLDAANDPASRDRFVELGIVEGPPKAAAIPSSGVPLGGAGAPDVAAPK